ncbi:MAG: DNA replication/repair protein RecF [Clostridia bacterium]|nr:DNA replication/repair protein RecF [Clostridia bacterium]
MQINSLSVKNFRNAEETRLEFDGGVNIICGANAAGKTNLLEAVFYFAAGKSFRNCRERELIRFGCESAEIKLEFADSAGNRRNMSAVFQKDRPRVLKVGENRVTRLADYLGAFRAVIFTPDHLSLVKGAPENRRRFLDLAICQSFPRYAAALTELNRTLAQKNAVLRRPGADRVLLDVYNERLASLSAGITLNRRKYVRRLESEADRFISEMCEGRESLKTEYRSQGGDNDTLESLRERYREVISEHAETEIERGISLYGAHKDDFSVSINKKSARSYGSQGQQRSAVLALKLAEGELSARLTGEYPVFLLDDILSELDPARKEYILSRLEGRQVIITGCESGIFGAYGRNSVFIEDGRICSFNSNTAKA